MPFETATYASVDIGSHTVRLLIARVDEMGLVAPVCVERGITRLARSFRTGGSLHEDGVRASIRVLGEYADLIASHGVKSIACGATGVVRRAADGPWFMEEVRLRTGLSGSILSESAEAILSAKGVLSVLPRNGMGVLTFDLGGGTTEFLRVESSSNAPSWSKSIFLGASIITERFLREAPATDDSLREARGAIRSALREVVGLSLSDFAATGNVPGSWELVGTAGTVTTLAAIHLRMAPYVPHRVNGYPLTATWIESLIARLAAMSLAERREILGLEEGREDIILGGALIVHEILLGLERARMLVADAGLLEGLLLDLVEKENFGRVELRTPLKWCFPTEARDRS
ncbi:MAG: hypothetical protein MUC41_14725 [Syntrophobacteraceae bacterium]|jgi:exopolyphosphatase/guanosine-5'-triphosphate,3'-diphosphate pyrophosphatase|nr:hypothetical protein [Syntrophobacteraceae bacterium]